MPRSEQDVAELSGVIKSDDVLVDGRVKDSLHTTAEYLQNKNGTQIDTVHHTDA